MEKLDHPIPPVWDASSRILLLGSFPSPKSREQAFFYGHPQNRFWRVLAAVYAADLPQSMDEKIAFLHTHHLALWDVIAACRIEGAADSSVRDAVPNDLTPILSGADIAAICTTGLDRVPLVRSPDRAVHRHPCHRLAVHQSRQCADVAG